MKLKFKKTGEILEVPEQFARANPDLYEAPTQEATQQTKTQTAGPSVSEFAGNVGQDIGSNIQGLISIPGLLKDILTGKQSAPEVGKNIAQGLVEEYKGLVVNPETGKLDITQPGRAFYNKPVSTILDVLPFLQAGKAGMARFGKAGTAAKVAEGTRIAEIAGEAGKVAETASLFDELKTVAKQASKKTLGQKITGIGEDLRKAVLNPQAEATPRYFQTVDEAVQLQNKLGLTGSAENQLKQIGSQFDVLDKKISPKLKGIKTQALKKTMVGDFMDELNSTRTDDISLYSKAIDEIERKIEEISVKGSAPAENIYKLKSQLRKELTPTFKKLERGADLKPLEEAKYAAYNSLKKTLDTLDETIRPINTLEHQLFELSKGLTETARGTDTSGILQLISTSKPAQIAKDIAGKTLVGTGTALDAVLKSKPADIAGQVAQKTGKAALQTAKGPIPNVLNQALQTQQPQEQQTQSLEDMFAGTADESATADTEAKKRLQKAMILDLTKTGGKHISELKMISEVLNPVPAKETQLSAKDRGNVRSGKSSLKEVVSMLDKDPSILVKRTLTGGLASRQYDAASYNAADIILRLRTGAQANESEIRGLQQTMFPWIGDSKEDATFKLKQLENIFKSYEE